MGSQQPAAPGTPLLVLVEPFCGGSHKQLIGWLEELASDHGSGCTVKTVTLGAKKWHWKLMGSSVWASAAIPPITARGSTLFCSSMCNLAELLGLRPDLRLYARCVYYFHENQLSYPARTAPDAADTPWTDGAYGFSVGWAQIVSALAADVVAFNSRYNLESFLEGIERHCAIMPDAHLRIGPELRLRLSQKCSVAYFPVPRPPHTLSRRPDNSGSLRICWPHRWEWDKNPAAFFALLAHLMRKGRKFQVVVAGESFAEVPTEFESARVELETGGFVAHWGYVPGKAHYLELLASCDLVISTAVHEFFGVSIVEAIGCGCIPLCPDRLAYPELLSLGGVPASNAAAAAPAQVASVSTLPDTSPTAAASIAKAPRATSPFLYRSERDLRQRMYELCSNPGLVRDARKRWRELEVESGGEGGCPVTVGEAAEEVDGAADTSELHHHHQAYSADALLGLSTLLQRVSPAALTPVYHSLLFGTRHRD